jgi:hypothetical protein
MGCLGWEGQSRERATVIVVIIAKKQRREALNFDSTTTQFTTTLTRPRILHTYIHSAQQIDREVLVVIVGGRKER